MFSTIKTILKESLQDNATGRYSSARIISMLVAFAATAFMWKLVITGGMTIEYFIAYLAYGSGNAGLNKFLDNKDTARVEQARAVLPPPVQQKEDEPKPPKE